MRIIILGPSGSPYRQSVDRDILAPREDSSYCQFKNQEIMREELLDLILRFN
jgi:hypothetical protein